MTVALLFSPLSKYTNMAELFVLSRFIVGICVGMCTTVQGVFLTEISPGNLELITFQIKFCYLIYNTFYN